MNVLTKEVEDVNVFRASKLRNLDDKGGIVEESLYVGDRVGADKRVSASDGSAEGFRATVDCIDIAYLEESLVVDISW